MSGLFRIIRIILVGNKNNKVIKIFNIVFFVQKLGSLTDTGLHYSYQLFSNIQESCIHLLTDYKTSAYLSFRY